MSASSTRWPPTTRRVLVTHALSATAMSLPWPLLLVMVASSTGSATLLGLAAAARLAPYVALSWCAGRLADRHARDRIVRATLTARAILLAGTAAAVVAGEALPVVVLAACAVAAGTPAYPALAAGMPRLAGPRSERATELLVTIEVASFVVGPAVGGLLLLAPTAHVTTAATTVALALASLACYSGIRQPRPDVPAEAVDGSRLRVAAGPLRRALLAVMLVNAVTSGAAVSLLPLAAQRWSGSGSAYGLATALIGFGALGGPLLAASLPGSRGRRSHPPLVPGLVAVGVALAAVAVAPTAWWAAVPLLLAGAAAVQVEAAATETIQCEAGDGRSAGVLGLADTLMVAAGLVGALAAPVLAGAVGAVPTLLLLGALSALPPAVGGVRQHLPRPARHTGYAALTTPALAAPDGRPLPPAATSGHLDARRTLGTRPLRVPPPRRPAPDPRREARLAPAPAARRERDVAPAQQGRQPASGRPADRRAPDPAG